MLELTLCVDVSSTTWMMKVTILYTFGENTSVARINLGRHQNGDGCCFDFCIQIDLVTDRDTLLLPRINTSITWHVQSLNWSASRLPIDLRQSFSQPFGFLGLKAHKSRSHCSLSWYLERLIGTRTKQDASQWQRDLHLTKFWYWPAGRNSLFEYAKRNCSDQRVETTLYW
jgi:hypothetical protein